MDEDLKGIVCFGLTMLTIMISPVILGTGLSLLWRWYVIPLFPSIIPISIPEGIGIMLLVSLFIGRSSDFFTDELSPEEMLVAMIMSNIATPILIIVLGWIIHHFV